jgi:Astacin (Peptidase family M12A)
MADRPGRPRVCVDRSQPQTLRAEFVERQNTPWYARPDDARAAAPTGSLWVPGQTITLAFLREGPAEGDAAIIEQRVRAIAEEWTRHANLALRWLEGHAAIRIAFENTGSWSFIGTECLGNAEGATMNFGWLSPDLEEAAFRSVVLHEFGHALGLIHEHQNPSVKVDWNRDAVYRDYAKPPNQWPPDQVDANVFAPYDAATTQFTDWDRRSIMMYPIPPEHLNSGEPVGWNTELSDNDKVFVESLYPFPPKPD